MVLAPSTDGKVAQINKEMVYRGFANWDAQTKHYLMETIVWSEDTVEDETVEDEVWDEYDDKEEKQDENIDSDKKALETSKTEAAFSTGEDIPDIISILTNGDFDLGNPDFLLSLLPPEQRKSLKDVSTLLIILNS